MKRKCLKNMCLAGILCVVCSVLTGCGGEMERGVVGSSVREGAVSGAAVSGEAVSEAGRFADCPYANSSGYYRKREESVIWCDRESGEKEEISIPRFAELVQVTEEEIYYTKYSARQMKEKDDPVEHNYGSILCRTPIRTKEGGKGDLELEKEEVLFRDEGNHIGGAVCIGSRYVVYTTELWAGGCCLVYDWQEQKEIPLEKEVTRAWIYGACGEEVIVREQDDMEGRGTFYQLTPATGKMRKIESGYSLFPYTIEVEEEPCSGADQGSACSERYFYYRTDTKPNKVGNPAPHEEKVCRYDVQSGENVVLATQSEIENALRERDERAEFTGILSFFAMPEDAGALGGVYVQIQYALPAEETGKREMRCAVFEKTDAASDIKFREDILPFADEKDSSEDSERCCCQYLTGGKWILHCRTAEKQGDVRLGCYDPDTGNFRVLTETDEEYEYPYYVDMFPGIFEDW